MDEARLREKLAKLEALASERNPNAHERAAARAKADRLRARLPKPKPTFDQLLWGRRAKPDQSRELSAIDIIDAKIAKLEGLLLKLKPASQLIAAEYAMMWHTQGELTKGQLRFVDLLINEAEGN